MVRAAGIGTEEVEQAVAAIVLHLDPSRWVAVDIGGSGERLRHTHPPRCPKAFRAVFQGNHVVKLQVGVMGRVLGRVYAMPAGSAACSRLKAHGERRRQLECPAAAIDSMCFGSTMHATHASDLRTTAPR